MFHLPVRRFASKTLSEVKHFLGGRKSGRGLSHSKTLREVRGAWNSARPALKYDKLEWKQDQIIHLNPDDAGHYEMFWRRIAPSPHA